MKRNIKQSTATGLIFGTVFVLSAYISSFTFAIFVSILGAVACFELAVIFKHKYEKVPLIICTISTFLIIFSCYIGGEIALVVSLILCILFIILYSSFERNTNSRNSMLTSGIFLLIYIPFLLSYLILLRDSSSGAQKVIFVFLSIAFSDIGGLTFGMKFGRTKMCPVISPKKTWEGFLGSLIFALAISVLYIQFVFPSVYYAGNYWFPFAFSLLCSIFGTIGDLIESLIKRDARVKDSGKILAGHGGILDRLDSTMLSAPFLYIFIMQTI
ncbi:MAG: phosphatidate cytidylyltransferase [Candidatus Ancillula sp.]|jgi:phosphatidate cytidylyltransferase|nr:phosphatidate cytidylyltransferase [Candidatus Ancillula sp.]